MAGSIAVLSCSRERVPTMPTVRLSILASTCLAALLSPLTARAQLIAGSSLYFDHGPDEQAYVQSYQLCAGADCRDLGVTRVGTTVTLTATLPAWVPRGRTDYTVRAIWKAPLSGTSAPTNVLSLVVVGPPQGFRTTAVLP